MKNQSTLRRIAGSPAEAIEDGSNAWQRLSELVATSLRNMYPGYFALVMGTGIVSNALFLVGRRGASDILLGVNLIAYPILVLATIARAILYTRNTWADLVNPRLVFTFFTFVAGTDVLGIQLFLRDQHDLAASLWFLALIFWVVLGYFSFSVLTFMNTQQGAEVVHGGWLIAIVGTQSLVLLGTLLAPQFGHVAAATYMMTHSLWGVGLILYGIFVTLFSYRIFFVRLEPEQMNPLFWVVMGAAAISTNAGSALILCASEVPFLSALRPFVEGATLVLWAWSTWLIPLLLIYGVWRHMARRVPLTYSAMYWSVVFPLGMYSVATWRLALAADYAPLRVIPRFMVWVALAAWILTTLGLLRQLVGAAAYVLGRGAPPANADSHPLPRRRDAPAE